MPKKVLSTIEEISDFVHGLTFLGTGGGGGPAETGIRRLSAELEAGHEVGWVGIDDLAPEAWTVTVAGMGGRPPKEGPSAEELASFGLLEEKYPRPSALLAAVKELADYARVQVEAIIPIELGSGNTPAPMVIANQLGIPTVDGDYAGRAIPEVTNLKPEIYDVPIWPIAYVDRWGDVCLVKETASTAMADRIGRMLCAGAYGGVGIACYLMRAKDARKVIVGGTLSKALQIGRSRREALEKGQDPVEAIVRATEGWLLFKGDVAEAEWEDREGYMFGYGTHYLNGIEAFKGRTFRVWYKNENHITWLDDQPLATSPDIIAVVDLETGEAKPNSQVTAGQQVAVIGMKTQDPAYRTEKGLEILSPRHFGFDMEYVPIEESVKSV